MVKHLSGVCAVWLAAATACCALPAGEYKVGDKAAEEIKTPVPLVVVDAEATQKLREREAQRVHAIYRFLPHAASESEAAFRSTFIRTRTNFLDAMQARFGKRLVTAEEAGSRDFQRFLTQFQRQNVLFPAGPKLTRLWALGESDAEMEAALLSKLRAAMRTYVRPDTAPRDVWVGSTIRLVSAADNEKVTAEMVNERGVNVPKTEFVSAQRAKTDLIDGFPAEERSVAKYLASFIKPNCDMEADLTRDLRNQRTEGLLVAERYDAGQVLVRRGQAIDRKILAALDELGQTQPAVPDEPHRSAELDLFTVERGAWLVVGACMAVMLLLLFAVIRLTRRPTVLPPTVSSSMPLLTTGNEAEWRARALEAEQQAAKAREVVRTGLLSQLAGWMSDKFTQKLVAQRTQLVDAQHKAALEVAELEARLEKVQAPLQERLAAYETRIGELEKELVAKDEQNRQLIKAKIQIIRKQLELERDKSRLDFN